MTLLFAVWGLASSVIALSGQNQAPQAQGTPRYVEIDGGKDPHLIPEYAVWEYSFRVLASRRDPENKNHSIDIQNDLPATDVAEILRTAVIARDRYFACWEEMTTKDKVLRDAKVPEATVRMEVGDKALACRQETLDTADALLASLSHNSRQYLVTWVNRRKQGMHFRILEANMAFFRKPR